MQRPHGEGIEMTADDIQHNTRHLPRRRDRKRTRGQSIVEFAVVVPFLLLFLVLAADFGRAYTAYLTISSAAREGATYASRSAANADDTTEIQNRVRDEVGSSGEIWGEPLSISVSQDTDTQNYDRVEVTVEYTFQPLFSVWPIPDTVPMERSVQMRVLGN